MASAIISTTETSTTETETKVAEHDNQRPILNKNGYKWHLWYPARKTYIDKWVNAQEIGKLYTGTFKAISKEDLMKIRVGMDVKICNGEERFWVEVRRIFRDDNDPMTWRFYGLVDNYLKIRKHYETADMVMFEGCHIYAMIM
jgi:hypothetical protein